MLTSEELLEIVRDYFMSCEHNPCFSDCFDIDYTDEEKERWLAFHEKTKQEFKNVCEQLQIRWCKHE